MTAGSGPTPVLEDGVVVALRWEPCGHQVEPDVDVSDLRQCPVCSGEAEERVVDESGSST